METKNYISEFVFLHQQCGRYYNSDLGFILQKLHSAPLNSRDLQMLHKSPGLHAGAGVRLSNGNVYNLKFENSSAHIYIQDYFASVAKNKQSAWMIPKYIHTLFKKHVQP